MRNICDINGKSNMLEKNYIKMVLKFSGNDYIII